MEKKVWDVVIMTTLYRVLVRADPFAYIARIARAILGGKYFS